MTQYQGAHIGLLKQYGHLKGVEDADLGKLTMRDEVVIEAVKSYQHMWYEELEPFTQRDHRRPPDANGEYGPSTESLLQMPRCGQPDSVGTDELQAIPQECRFEITTSYKPGMTLRGLSASLLESLWIESNLRLMEAVECTLTFNPDSYPSTVFYAFDARLGGSVLADHMLGHDCQPHRGRYDNDRTWSETLFLAVAAHEKVHGLGVGHTQANGALMNPFIHAASRQRRGALIDADIRMLERVGYQRRTDQPPPGPGPSPATFITGTVNVHSEAGIKEYLIQGRES